MSISPTSSVISENLSEINSEIAEACARSGRATTEVQLVAVTKYAEWHWVEALYEHHTVFGENRPQQLAERSVLLPNAKWHLIGQLQRNKVRSVIEHAAMIHSIDSLKLLQRTAQVATELQKRPRILLQVNISGEASKSGFSAGELIRTWTDVTQYQSDVEIVGLMTMAPASGDADEARATFRGLAELRQQLAEHSATAANHIELVELSMGMSGDFQVAIEEGATMIRVGSRLYEGL
jgi:pyridoxal phosphate enzyme (YggS family)